MCRNAHLERNLGIWFEHTKLEMLIKFPGETVESVDRDMSLGFSAVQ